MIISERIDAATVKDLVACEVPPTLGALDSAHTFVWAPPRADSDPPNALALDSADPGLSVFVAMALAPEGRVLA